MQTVLRGFWTGVLWAFAIATVLSAAHFPEARLLIVAWLLAVALMWRRSPRRDA